MAVAHELRRNDVPLPSLDALVSSNSCITSVIIDGSGQSNTHKLHGRVEWRKEFPQPHGLPGSREHVKELQEWMKNELNGLQKQDPRSLILNSQAIYGRVLGDISDQVSRECRERGQLLQEAWEGYVSLFHRSLCIMRDEQRERMLQLKEQSQSMLRSLSLKAEQRVHFLANETYLQAQQAEKVLKQEIDKLNETIVANDEELASQSQAYSVLETELFAMQRLFDISSRRYESMLKTMEKERDTALLEETRMILNSSHRKSLPTIPWSSASGTLMTGEMECPPTVTQNIMTSGNIFQQLGITTGDLSHHFIHNGDLRLLQVVMVEEGLRRKQLQAPHCIARLQLQYPPGSGADWSLSALLQVVDDIILAYGDGLHLQANSHGTRTAAAPSLPSAPFLDFTKFIFAYFSQRFHSIPAASYLTAQLTYHAVLQQGSHARLEGFCMLAHLIPSDVVTYDVVECVMDARRAFRVMVSPSSLWIDGESRRIPLQVAQDVIFVVFHGLSDSCLANLTSAVGSIAITQPFGANAHAQWVDVDVLLYKVMLHAAIQQAHKGMAVVSTSLSSSMLSNTLALTLTAQQLESILIQASQAHIFEVASSHHLRDRLQLILTEWMLSDYFNSLAIDERSIESSDHRRSICYLYELLCHEHALFWRKMTVSIPSDVQHDKRNSEKSNGAISEMGRHQEERVLRILLERFARMLSQVPCQDGIRRGRIRQASDTMLRSALDKSVPLTRKHVHAIVESFSLNL